MAQLVKESFPNTHSGLTVVLGDILNNKDCTRKVASLFLDEFQFQNMYLRCVICNELTASKM